MALDQLALSIVALGAAYTLVALGFVLVLNATRAVNFAHGDTVMAGGFAAIVLAGALPLGGVPVPGLVLLPLVALAMAAFGALFSAVAYFPLRDRPVVSIFISTIAVGIMLQTGANGLFGGADRKAPPIVEGGALEVSGLVVDRQAIAIVAVALLCVAALYGLLWHTQTGRRMRAAAEDPELARATGVRLERMVVATFAVAAALAGVAGLLLANQYFVTPTAGVNFMFKAYIAVTIGGWGDVRGAVVGAFIIAVIELIGGILLSTAIAEVILYCILLAVLLVRPQGLFGEPAGRRA